MELAIEHDRDARRFNAVVDGHRCVLDYTLSGDRMSIVHTGVPASQSPDDSCRGVPPSAGTMKMCCTPSAVKPTRSCR